MEVLENQYNHKTFPTAPAEQLKPAIELTPSTTTRLPFWQLTSGAFPLSVEA